MCQNQKINAWIKESKIEGFIGRAGRAGGFRQATNCNCPKNNNSFNFGQFNIPQTQILKLMQKQYQNNQPRDEISKNHAPRISDQSCDKPKTCPKCDETPYCTSNGWACDTMDVESTDNSCI